MPRSTHSLNMDYSILRISDEKTIQLVQECEKQECLWNTQIYDYPNKEDRAKAYQIIAENLNIPDFTARHVMTKFKNLRNSYCQELKKIAANERYKPKVLWFKHMDKYLKPHLQKIQAYTANQRLLQKRRAKAEATEDAEDVIDTTDWVVESPGVHSLHSDASSSNQSPLHTNTTTKITNKSIQLKRKLSTDSEDEGNKIKQSYSDIEDNSMEFNVTIDPLTGISSEINPVETTARHPNPIDLDHFDTFGTYVASLMKSLPVKKAMMLEPKIINMIVSVGVEDLSDD